MGVDKINNVIEKFEHMNFRKEILRGIFGYGFEIPSSIQKQAIPAFLTGKDLIAQAQSGTGKTATFSLSVLQTIDETNDTIQAIILSPTRELSEQIYNVIQNLAKYTKIKFCLLLGGQSRRDQIKQLSQSVHCIICTPGRINDLLYNGFIQTSNVKCLILDEADELLTDAFQYQIKDIIHQLPETTQIGIYSATMTRATSDIAMKFMRDPQFIEVKKEQLTLEGISQYHIYTENDRSKYDTIVDLYSTIIINQLIIYCNTKQRVMFLAQNLQRDGYACSFIHSELTTDERMHTMNTFRKGDTRVLISTDLLSRGIDVQQISLVINYDIPKHIEVYLHRIGRSGRYGRKGVALNLINSNDVDNLKRIETYYQTEIPELPMNFQHIFSSK